ncbi:hypothetical protein VOLCADRAFT_88605 [Volvox carteri f. nagariensis]|uniref:Carotenoid oxygenase n=1 Tax=Volvox carteri f. nagariensis TaxID=3068 RepID=D8TPG2_VOLCA|nr:uncharacterized protein VOLCADRAFT_88605 [Volvox carteri f. nagariensis]EFJ50758.1 hypothetical protein VOLCADRAFT_88605 [Volvox carteri f. nagariensis]|eukprot:XP_002948351.1 hypothetical protein VOLCADRAFT_88605 [Volvox carteri f. nagariensis]
MGINLDEHVPVVHKRSRKAKPVTVAMLNDVRTMFTSLLHEYAYWVDESWVTGTIPPELYGTYYRNGPALHVTNPRYRRHILDGDGMVFSIAFKDGKAYFRNRFVRTKGFLEEQAAGHPLYRNSFTRGSHDGSTPWFNPLDLTFKNVANTGVLPWGGQLYALWEAGLPYLMDPTSLATHRESRMGGQIRANTFAAHYRIVTEGATSCSPSSAAAVGAKATASNANANASQQPQQRHMEHGAASMSAAAAAAGHAYSGSSDNTCSSSSCRRLVTFSNEFSYGGATAVFYEFDEAGQLLHETRHRLQGLDIALIHDMVVTEHYYVLVVGSIHLDPFKFLTQYALGLCSIAEVMVFDPRQPTRIMMFPRPARPSGKVLAPRVLTTEPLFVFHNVNGWEEEEEEEEGGEGAPAGGMKVVLDCVAWDEVSFDMGLFDKYKQRVDGFVGGARTQLTRLTCDLRTGAVECRKLLQRTVEFPMTDPRVTARRHSVAWFIADAVDHPVLWGPAQSVIRVEVEPDTAPRTAAATTGGEGGGRPAAAAVEPRQLAPPRPAAGTVRGLAAGAAPGLAVDCWYLGDRTFPGEPMFIPRPGSSREGDGWLLVAVHNADSQRADVLIFDAEALSAGPLATLHLPHRLPVSLHGAWDPTYRGPDPHDPKVPRWQEPSVVRPM